MTDFPYRKYTTDQLLLEFERLKNKVDKTKTDSLSEPLSYSSIGYPCSNAFFQEQRMSVGGYNRASTFDYWRMKHDKVICFSERIKRDLFSTLNYFNHAPSQFPIVVAATLYRHFKATKVFDPYAGWGDRMLGALALNIDYTGVDSNPNLHHCYQQVINTYPSTSKVQFYYNKSENLDIPHLDFDFVLTSPPFFNEKRQLQELYPETERDYVQFFQSFVKVVKRCMIKSKIWICLHLPVNMANDLMAVIGYPTRTIKFRTGCNRTESIYCWYTN